jgi:hypothetical protein
LAPASETPGEDGVECEGEDDDEEAAEEYGDDGEEAEGDVAFDDYFLCVWEVFLVLPVRWKCDGGVVGTVWWKCDRDAMR